MLAQSDGPGPSATSSREAALGSGSSALESMMADKKQEEWRPIRGYPGYEVSDMGRVRSHHSWRGMPGPRILKASRHRKGYLAVSLCRGGARLSQRVHVLVLGAFVGPRADGYQCRHLDGNPGNNRPGNLAWGTAKENVADAIGHGTFQYGIGGRHPKLTPDAVLEIRRLWKAGAASTGQLGRQFGVHRKTITNILTLHNWAWLGVPDE